ncbi:MAG: adenylate/guanylate cyclase domain-containing protein [Candidatus Rokubacteria bacterium]|nr:adenylate/guanylate cyclase domain-containing protein [Candidatus Rokubacteria bacterium]
MGTSEAGALSLLFAATYPSRTAALVLLNSYARLAYAPDYAHGTPAEQAQGLLQAIEEGWGKGVAFEALVASQANNAPMKRWWSRYQRLAASPGAAVALLRSAFGTDARAVLPAIAVPVLVLHRAGDPFTGPEHGRYLAERIHGGRYVELSGVDHPFFAEDVDRLLGEVQEFLTGVRLGDREWRDLLDRSYAFARRQLTRFRGREIDTAGDGLFATFDGPARAIRCGSAIADAVRVLGITVRVGIHSGECEVFGERVGGIAVHTGARIAGQAGPGEVLVSSTVRDLVAGSGIPCEDRGRHSLKGVPGEWSLFAVAAGG